MEGECVEGKTLESHKENWKIAELIKYNSYSIVESHKENWKIVLFASLVCLSVVFLESHKENWK